MKLKSGRKTTTKEMVWGTVVSNCLLNECVDFFSLQLDRQLSVIGCRSPVRHIQWNSYIYKTGLATIKWFSRFFYNNSNNNNSIVAAEQKITTFLQLIKTFIVCNWQKMDFNWFFRCCCCIVDWMKAMPLISAYDYWTTIKDLLDDCRKLWQINSVQRSVLYCFSISYLL